MTEPTALTIETLEEEIARASTPLAPSQPPTSSGSAKVADIGTETALFELATRQRWETKEDKTLSFLGKRLDISSSLHTGYFKNGTRKGFRPLREPEWLKLATWLFLKHAEVADKADTSLVMRRYNIVFKSLSAYEALDDVSDIDSSALSKAVNLGWDVANQQCVSTPPGETNILAREQTQPAIDAPIQLPLTVLFYEGPIARAYLAMMKQQNLQPKHLIELVAANDVVTKKPVGVWLPKNLRNRYASYQQRRKIHHWPKHIANHNSALVAACRQAAQRSFHIDPEAFDDALALEPLEKYSASVSVLPITGLKDPALLELVANSDKETFLFTGGGIVPATLLSASNSKFLHIHPGFLPDVRGADCTLWSSLINDHCAATCFYMAPGIDTGDIVKARWFPHINPATDLRDAAESADTLLRYRCVYSFLDPWVRAAVLREVLLQHPNELYNLPSQPQSESDGTTYHFMHNELKKRATEGLFGL